MTCGRPYAAGGRGLSGGMWGWGRRVRDQPWDDREVATDAMMGMLLFGVLGRQAFT